MENSTLAGIARERCFDRHMTKTTLQECRLGQWARWRLEKCKNGITRRVGGRDRARGGGKEAAPQEAAQGDRERDLKARKRGENRATGWSVCWRQEL